MLADAPERPAGARALPSAAGRPWYRERTGRARACTFAVTFAGVLLCALRGGAYDIVVRQEYGLLAWWLVLVGVASGLLPRSRPSRSALGLVGALLLVSGWQALSLTWTESAERSFDEVARVVAYAGLVALCVCLLDRRNWRSAMLGLTLGACTVCLLALERRLFAHAAVGSAERVFRSDRLDYPFGYWNAAAAWGAMSAVLALTLSAHERRRAVRSLLLALVPVACATTYLTYSRTGAIATVAAALASLAAARNRLALVVHLAAGALGTAIVVFAIRDAPQIARATGTAGRGGVLAGVLLAAALGALTASITSVAGVDRHRVSPRLFRPAAGVLVCAVAIAGAAFGPHLVSRAWDSFRHTTPPVGADPAARLSTLSGTRYDLWRVALDAFDHRPLTGTGAGTYELWWNRHARNGEFVRNAHSLWLENMAELGAPGLLLIVAVALTALGAAISARRRAHRPPSAGAAGAAIALLLVFLVTASVDWMWQSTAVAALALTGAAVASARTSRAPRRLRVPVRVGAAVLALGLVAVELPGLFATLEIRRSQAAARSGALSVAGAWASAATVLEPWAASPYIQRALVWEEAGHLATAAADLDRSIDRGRNDFIPWLLRARVEAERNDLSKAAGDLEQAHRLRPLGNVTALPAASTSPRR